VTDADVDRVIARDVPPEARSAVRELLARYGDDPWEREPARVRLAILKLAGGDLARMTEYLELACRDFRDVLIAAEYPLYYQRSMRGPFGRNESAEAIEADWRQYKAWLERR